MAPTHVLAVMGETGVETSTITSYEVTIRDRKYVLVDTPGFNDTYLSDSEVLRRLVEWLKSTYQAGTKLSGILYLHRITDSRMQGPALRNLNIFRQLCGEDFYKNITLGTTCWALVPTDVAEKRENELIRNSNFWKPMLDRGARLEQIPDDVEASRNLVARISNHEAAALQVVEEMERGTSFVDLAATKMMNYELEEQRKQQEFERQRLLEEQDADERQREAQRKIQAEAHELQMRRQFHVNIATQCAWTRPHGSCDRCGGSLSRWNMVYHCCSCYSSDNYWHCYPCGNNCGSDEHPSMRIVGKAKSSCRIM